MIGPGADARVLVTTRPAGKSFAGLWEFPGGKLEGSELPEQCVVRELMEELGVETSVSCLEPAGFASQAIDGRHLLLLLFACRNWRGPVSPREGQRAAWHRVPELWQLAMPDADRPLLALLEGAI